MVLPLLWQSAGVMESTKSQTPSTKQQTNLKFQALHLKVSGVGPSPRRSGFVRAGGCQVSGRKQKTET
jgi:hypothetical protein